MTTDVLEGVALAERVAELMGWIRKRAGSNRWLVDSGGNYGGERYIGKNLSNSYLFRPDCDHNHAAELRAWACEKWPGYFWIMKQSRDGCEQWYFRNYQAPNDWKWSFFHEDMSGCIAVCHVFIKAAEALGAGG